MIYDDLLKAHLKYGTSIDQVSKHKLNCDTSLIRKNVVLAPTMTCNFLTEFGAEITPILSKYHSISNVKLGNLEFTFITTGIGAPNVVDIVLALGSTSCKNIIFIGSVGSLDKDINIGDIVLPISSICGDGVCRYLTGKPLVDSDTFGLEFFPNKNLFDLSLKISQKICADEKVSIHTVKNYSIDTIFAQFAHIDEIKHLGASVIAMETASLFRASQICNISACAIFCVSDNTVNNKSLYSVRTEDDKKRKGVGRYIITPKILIELLNNL